MFGLPKTQKRKEVFAKIGGASLTKQSFIDEADINNIMRKYSMNDIELGRQALENYEFDATEIPDFHEAMNKVAEAQQLFLTMPSNIREVFNHDAGRFLDFVQDPENSEELVEMGLARPKSVSAQQPQVAGGDGTQPAKAGKKEPQKTGEQSTSS